MDSTDLKGKPITRKWMRRTFRHRRCARHGGSSPSTPLSILGTKLHTWYRADTVTITGSGVSSWTDKSGNGNHALQGTDANRPGIAFSWKNGKDAVSFTAGSSQYLRSGSYHASLTQPCTKFLVCDFLTGFAIVRTVVSGLANGNRHTLAANTTPAWSFAANTGPLTGGTPAVGTNYLVRVDIGATDVVTVNGSGVISGDAGAVSEAGITIGANHSTTQFHNGRIGEIVIANAALSAQETTDMSAYFASYWGAFP